MKKCKKILTGKKRWILVLSVLAAVAAIVIICCSLGQGSKKPEQDDGSFETIQSKYVDWSVPSECMEFLRYENETTSNTVADLFFLKLGNVEMPIFRFDFGDENAGDWLGLLTIGEEKIPVVYTVFVLTDEELATIDGAEEKYYKLMDVFNELVKSLDENENFSEAKPVKVSGNKQNVKLTYWTVNLPAEMSCLESNENGTYQVGFYGDFHGEKVELYRVIIGQSDEGSPLGFYQIDGKDQIVSVVSHDFDRADWTDDDYALAYRLLESINDVLEQITTSKYYSEK